MSNVGIFEFSMEKCFQDMPYEVLYEIFCTIHRGKLIEISKLCSKFRDIAGDKRLWKNVYIKYEPDKNSPRVAFDFEELYSEPWPVKVIDFTDTKINSPVYSQTDQVVKVTKLVLSSTMANKATMEAILTKYQCTELYLSIDLEIEPEVFSKQTSLEVLSLQTININADPDYHDWLAPVMNYCKNLKTLDLRDTYMYYFSMLNFIKILPTSLEKLFLATTYPGYYYEDSFFKPLAKRTPNLRELGLSLLGVRSPTLLEFQFLEILHVSWTYVVDINISEFYTYLIKLPVLKTVLIVHSRLLQDAEKEGLEKLRGTLEPHGIIVRLIKEAKKGPSVNDNLWKVR